MASCNNNCECGQPCWRQDNHGGSCDCRSERCPAQTAVESHAAVTLYVVRNHEGHYFRAKGRDGWNKKSWVPDLESATVYAKLSTVRARVTYFATHNPNNLPVPVIVELQAIETRVLDERTRVGVAKLKKDAKVATNLALKNERELERLRKELMDAQARLDALAGARR